MIMIDFVNRDGKAVSVDAGRICAVVDRGNDCAGLRLSHPDIIVVKGEFLTVKTKVEAAKKAILAVQTGRPFA